MKREAPSEYPTKDIYLATVLHQAGIPLRRVDNFTGHGIFVFKASKKINDIIMKYFNRELRTDPKSLFETWKALKSMAYSAINNVK